jgi:hypothetical protein
LVHAKGGICGPLKEGKQLTLEHPRPPKCKFALTGTNGLLK